ncbi:DUF6284 family protein [Actinacidiphila oryziradicis]|uniref:Uncharacterized protein n=1 Tax=Actinacidiphila oryziradicis TaxID=2571141 RepID=A0A4U0RD81_9ACTN|nr:DUF6284 family protein [Actinacidiphila oryziradicis]TJZ93185.1 hypothetical protein FCI23_54640 [Actinacidiphila oryziradicis]
MRYIAAGHEAVAASAPDREPTTEELAVIEREMPVIRAEIELLDAQIAAMHHPLSPLDTRRLRRAERRLLAELSRLAIEERMTGAAVAG